MIIKKLKGAFMMDTSPWKGHFLQSGRLLWLKIFLYATRQPMVGLRLDGKSGNLRPTLRSL